MSHNKDGDIITVGLIRHPLMLLSVKNLRDAFHLELVLFQISKEKRKKIFIL